MAIAFASVILLAWLMVVLWMRSRAGVPARQQGPNENVETLHIDVDGQARCYHIVRKPGTNGTPRPVLLALHGGTNGAENFLQRSGLAGQCFAAGMDLVLPETEGAWADGRATTSETWDNDRRYIEVILTDLAKDPHLDETRVFAVGISSGAMFAIRLGLELGQRLGGICAVSGAVPEDIADRVTSGPALPILFVNSDDDRLVPMQGGEMPTLGGRAAGGRILSTSAAVTLWRQRNDCETEPVRHAVTIGTYAAQVSDYRGGPSGADVSSIILHKAGHSWPADRPEGQITLEQLVIRFFQRQMRLASEKKRPAHYRAAANNFSQESSPT